jgi:hypothetical protein
MINFKVNLETELLKQNKRVIVPDDLLVIAEAEKLAQIPTAQQVLKRLNMEHNLAQGQSLMEAANTEKAALGRFNQQRVFHISQIESLCKKYHLRFLNPKLYKGTIDPELVNKVTTFEVAYLQPKGLQNLEHRYYSQEEISCTQNNTMIMAPASSFKLQERPKDPLFFYKINQNYYYLIHKWGNDLSVFRRILGILSSPWLFYFCWVIGCTIASHSIAIKFDHPISWVASFIFGLVLGLIGYGVCTGGNDGENVGWIRPNMWNKEIK